MNLQINYRQLKDVCEIDKDQGIFSGLPYVGLENIESGSAKFVGDLAPQSVKSATFRLSPSHVLYGRLRPYLNKVLVPDFSGHCSTEIFPLKPSSSLLREYLCYWLRSDETVTKIDGTSTGARMPRANMNEVMEFTLPVPPLAKQRRIVGILDEAFAGLDAMRANADSNAESARTLFESQLDSVFFKPAPDWITLPLSAVCDITHGFAFDGADFALSDSSKLPVVLTPGNFTQNGELVFTDRNTKRYTGPTQAGYEFAIGDSIVVMTDLSSKMKILGRPAIVEKDKLLHNQRIGRFIFGDDRLEPRLLYYFLQTSTYLKNVKDTSTGTMVRHTAPRRILANLIAFPKSKSTQLQLIKQLDELRELTGALVDTQFAKQNKVDDLRKSLLHQAFSGNL